MTASTARPLANAVCFDSAINAAIECIAPTWPLDRMIAVNPYWGYINQPFCAATVALAKVCGSPMTLDAGWYREAWHSGTINLYALTRARDEMQSSLTMGQLITALDTAGGGSSPAPLLSDKLDEQRDLHHEPAWCDTITYQVSQLCAAFFDQDQSDWRPDQTLGLYQHWRATLAADHSVALLMRSPDIAGKVAMLAGDPRQQIEQALLQLSLPARDTSRFLQAVLMRIGGWAAWCAYLRWQAQLAGAEDDTLIHLLAIRLSWECLLDDGLRDSDSTWAGWQTAWQTHFQQPDNTHNHALGIWQRAQEISYQDALLTRLCSAPVFRTDPAVRVQAAFCIDVRSEVIRRHLEAQSADIQTLGFAGFFGLPISYEPLGSNACRPQLPGLLAPAMTITDSAGSSSVDASIAHRRDDRLRASRSWQGFHALPLSAFVIVESMGLSYLAQLVRRTLPGRAAAPSDNNMGLTRKDAKSLRPSLDATVAGGPEGQADIAAQVLTAMGLTRHFARLVLLIGHGSQTQNNPHRAGLECGACCGQKGDINARALAALLNDRAVRRQLLNKGLDIPDSTWFIAGLHNTTIDQIDLFDTEDLPDSHASDLATIKGQLASAQGAAACERAPALRLQSLQDKPQDLSRALRQRANDWAQTRPEWGLANNAAFVIGPRSATRGMDLEGRCFLHDYDADQDPTGTLLEQIMTAPMIVAHWINMQYYASTVDNQRFGSGNKTLHNVVGGRIGVFEGNAGDLRIGLPFQSVHNGETWQHTPLRLTVVIHASRAAIAAVVNKHDTVRQLVDNKWLYILRIEDQRAEMYHSGRWHLWQ
ncbi:MAG: hypothetical protein CMQ34_12060 [Gammaproteobacteria bacterium]|nr:hypothetical protein [Gammaproteobacteria bacterium]